MGSSLTFKKYDKPVSIHFNSKDHSIDDFRYAGIEISSHHAKAIYQISNYFFQ
jgi:hypothetical protein